MKQQLLYLFTRTPLHVGAGASVGAIDQPVVRERHTGFPLIPASTMKGVFADGWTEELKRDKAGNLVRVVAEKQDDKWIVKELAENAAWLFGSDNANVSWTGALQFSEARLLAFPIRSAKGGFAWITCPLMLQRAARDGVIDTALITAFPKSGHGQADKSDELAYFDAKGPLALGDKVVLEEYTFTHTGNAEAANVGAALATLVPDDPVCEEIASRLIILSDGMMSFFAKNACEIAQHVRIDDETGTAADSALFNQENVPSETLFYSLVHAFKEQSLKGKGRTEDDALHTLKDTVEKAKVFQFGGDASTGLGYCTVKLSSEKHEVAK